MSLSNSGRKKHNASQRGLPVVKEDVEEEVLQIDSINEKNKLSFDNLYGVLLYDNNIAIFVNKKQNNFIFNKKEVIKDQGIDQIKLTQYKIVNKGKIKRILDIFRKRLDYIYNYDSKNFKFNLNMNLNTRSMTRSMTRKGGNRFIIKIPIGHKHNVNFQLDQHNYENLFKLPDENYDFTHFIDEFAKCDRGYMSTTRDINHVNAIFLCFFHINEFQITTRFREYDINADIMNDENLKIPDDNLDKYPIIQKCKNLTCKSSVLCENPNFCVQQCQDYVYASQVINTAVEIFNIINNGGEKLFPVHVDAEADVANNERSFYIADGNHRIYTLKRLGYNGYVPCICCDYLPVETLK